MTWRCAHCWQEWPDALEDCPWDGRDIEQPSKGTPQ